MSSPETTLPHRAVDGVRTAFGIGGLIAVVLGLLILFFPGKSAAVALTVVAAIMAAYALVVGVVYLGTSIFSRSLSGWARTGHILLGLLYIIGGVVMMANLGASAVVLAVFLSVTIGVLWLFEGIMAFTVVGQSQNKVWTVIYAIVSVIAGLVLVFTPLVSAVTLWLLLGISMVVLGIVQVVRALKVKPVA